MSHNPIASTFMSRVCVLRNGAVPVTRDATLSQVRGTQTNRANVVTKTNLLFIDPDHSGLFARSSIPDRTGEPL
jgi:hypothetical protein